MIEMPEPRRGGLFVAKLVIEGRTRLSGEYYLSGSKNSSLSTMVAAALSDDTVILDNIPANTDVLTLARILQDLGVDVPDWARTPMRLAAARFQFQSHRMTWSGV